MKKEEAIRIIRKMLACTDLSVRANLNADMVDACHLAIKALEQEPKTGYWEWLRCDMYVCSECKNVYTDLSGIKDGMNYCPNCGSRNEVEE